MKKKCIVVGPFILITFLVSPLAFAIDSSSEVGAEATRFAEEQDLLERLEEAEDDLEESEGVESVDERGMTEAEKNIRFQLNSILISGNQTIPSDELDALVADEIGKESGLGDLRRIANTIKIKSIIVLVVISQHLLMFLHKPLMVEMLRLLLLKAF